jgi:hypothetical protein
LASHSAAGAFGAAAEFGHPDMTDTGQPIRSDAAPSRRRPRNAARELGLDAFTIFLLGVCAHLAATVAVVLAVMGLMQLFDWLAARLQAPALAGVLVGLAALSLIAGTVLLGFAAVRHRAWLAALLRAAVIQHEGLRRVLVWLGFGCAVGLRAVLLLCAATLPVTAVAIAPPRTDAGVSAVTVYALLALAYLVLAPLVAVRVRRGLRRMRIRRERALRSIAAS